MWRHMRLHPRSVASILLYVLGAAFRHLTTRMVEPTEYVDPTSGSLVLQIVAAGVPTAVFTAKRWWHRAASDPAPLSQTGPEDDETA